MNVKLIISAIALLAATLACTDAGNRADNDTTVAVDTIAPQQVLQPDTLRYVTGVAVDGGMNSIDLLVGGDTISFDFPDIANPVAWQDGDTLTVVLRTDNDSVVNIIAGIAG